MKHRVNRRVWAAAILTLSCGLVNAQEIREAQPGATPPAATLKLVEGLAGRWLGDSASGPMEAMFSEARHGKMVGHIIYWNDEGYRLIELAAYEERGDSVVYRVKHFNTDLVGVQEKDVTVDRPLIAVENGIAYFKDMTVALNGDAMTIVVRVGGQDLKLNYRRVGR